MQILTVIIPAADKDSENQWMKDNIDRAAGEFSFMSPLTTSNNVISHYWMSNQWEDDVAASIQEHFSDIYTGTPRQALTAAGLHRYIPSLT